MSSDTILGKIGTLITSSLAEARSQTTDFKTLEKNVVSSFMEAAAQLLGEMLQQYDIDDKFITYEGEQYVKSSRHPMVYFTSAGKVSVERTNYRRVDALFKRTITPMDLNVGIVNNNWTPQAAKIACLATAEMTPYSAEVLFKTIGAMAPSKSSLDRLPKRIHSDINFISEAVTSTTIENDSTFPEEATQITVSLDGVHIPIQKLRGKSRFIRDGGIMSPTYGQMIEKNEEYSRYREASCGTVSYLDKEGELIATHYYAQMPEEKKETLKKRLACHINQALKKKPDATLVAIADGAKDNWTFLEKSFPSSIKILDFYHAAEHLKTALDLSYKDQSLARQYFEEYRTILRHDANGIDRVIKFLESAQQAQPDNEELMREINYFKNNRDRCNYKQFADNNYPIGSGIVEAACKTIVSSRLKKSGMAWRWIGGQAIMNLRSYLKSGLFDQLWDCLESIYKRPISENLPC